jgi:hypothetical protein
VYKNEKIIPAETLPGISGQGWGLGINESDGGGEFKYDIFGKL